MLLDISDKKQRITNLTLKYDICIPFKKIAQILWINRLKELSYIKNKKVRHYRCRKSFINELYCYNKSPFEDDAIRKELNQFFCLMYYYILATDGKVDYGDTVYNEYRKYLYNTYGI